MKKNIQFILSIFALCFLIACEKENFQVDAIKAIDQTNFDQYTGKIDQATFKNNGNETDAIILEKETFKIKLVKELPKTGILNKKELFKKAVPKDQCNLNECNAFLNEYGARLQTLANETCEVQYGSIACCLDGAPIYAMVMISPEDPFCGAAVVNDTKEN